MVENTCTSVFFSVFFAEQFYFWKLPPPSPPQKKNNGPSITVYDILPAIVHFEKGEVNLQIFAVWNVHPITTVHVIWIEVWISGTKKYVALHISTWIFKKNKNIKYLKGELLR